MKIILTLTIMVTLLIACFAWAGTRIDLDAPINIKAQATTLTLDNITITNTSVSGSYSFLDASGDVLLTNSYFYDGADYTSLISANITAGKVGKAMGKVIEQGITNKIKSDLNLSGTVN